MKGPIEILEHETNNLRAEPTAFHNRDVDFSEYVWMAEGLEEFDRKVEEELWEEFFIEACFEDMFDEEEEDWLLHSDGKTIAMEKLECLQVIYANHLMKSTLNPNAPEFIPSSYKFDYYVDDDYEQR